MSDEGEGFLARWSRRKAGIAAPADGARGPAAPPVSQSSPIATAATPATPLEGARAAPLDGDAAQGADEPAAALPTLADVAALTRDSDFTRFMAPGVDGAVRNAAMKKLFSDPRFNVMDGLDIYIDDYGKPDPLPPWMLRQLRQSELLGLFSDDAAAASPDNAGTDADGAAAVPPSAPPTPSPPSNDAAPRAEDDPDLRLQPNDGDRRPGAGEGARD